MPGGTSAIGCGLVRIALGFVECSVLVPPREGGVAVGMHVSRGLLFVAGGPTGLGHVYDAQTGEEVAALQPAGAGGFVNDVIVTPDAAWFTNSFAAEIYRMDLKRGRPTGAFEAIPLGGDWVQSDGFNANGIEATPDGRALIVINSGSGSLFRVDPSTGAAMEIDSGMALTAGDGILLRGKELSVVRNQVNEIVVLRLSPDLSSAEVTRTLTDPDFAVPTTSRHSAGRCMRSTPGSGSRMVRSTSSRWTAPDRADPHVSGGQRLQPVRQPAGCLPGAGEPDGGRDVGHGWASATALSVQQVESALDQRNTRWHVPHG